MGVPLVGTAEAAAASIDPQTVETAVDSLQQQSGGHYKSWLGLMQIFVLVGMINYQKVLTVLTLIAYPGVYISPWIQKVHTWECNLPAFLGFMVKLMIVGVMLVGVLVCHMWSYAPCLSFGQPIHALSRCSTIYITIYFPYEYHLMNQYCLNAKNCPQWVKEL